MPKAKNAQLWERDPNDWYPEPVWCSEALFRSEAFTGPILDPCAGTGRIAAAASAAGYVAYASDLIDRERFLNVVGGVHYAMPMMTSPARTVVSNPPFKEAEAFVRTALSLGLDVACFLQLRFAGGATRTRWLEDTPLAAVGILAPRPSCPPGAVWMAGEATGSGGEIDHAWFIWRQGHKGPPVVKWMRKDGR